MGKLGGLLQSFKSVALINYVKTTIVLIRNSSKFIVWINTFFPLNMYLFLFKANILLFILIFGVHGNYETKTAISLEK